MVVKKENRKSSLAQFFLRSSDTLCHSLILVRRFRSCCFFSISQRKIVAAGGILSRRKNRSFSFAHGCCNDAVEMYFFHHLARFCSVILQWRHLSGVYVFECTYYSISIRRISRENECNLSWRIEVSAGQQLLNINLLLVHCVPVCWLFRRAHADARASDRSSYYWRLFMLNCWHFNTPIIDNFTMFCFIHSVLVW